MNPLYAFLLTNATTALVLVVITMILGFIWYGPLFGKRWAAIIGMAPSKQMSPEENKAFHKKMIPVYLLNMLSTFVLFFAFAYFTVFIGPMNTTSSMLYAVFVWFGFIVPTLVSNALWSGKSKKDSLGMFLINAGFQLVSFLLGGVIWSLVYPIFMM